MSAAAAGHQAGEAPGAEPRAGEDAEPAMQQPWGRAGAPSAFLGPQEGAAGGLGSWRSRQPRVALTSRALLWPPGHGAVHPALRLLGWQIAGASRPRCPPQVWLKGNFFQFFLREKDLFLPPCSPFLLPARVCEMALYNGQLQKWKLSSCEFQALQMFWRTPEARIPSSHLRGRVRTCSRTC